MSDFAESFRAEIDEAYHELINTKGDSLRVAQLKGVGGMAQWIRDQLYPELDNALECANPGDVDWACARIGLAALMMRDAGRAMSKMFDDAYSGPESERKEKIDAIYKAHSGKMSGAQWIAYERFRQIDVEKFDAKHDDEQHGGYGGGPALLQAAIAYAQAAETKNVDMPDRWPWDEEFWKPDVPIAMLVKAGALLAAEIDRRVRAGEPVKTPRMPVEVPA